MLSIILLKPADRYIIHRMLEYSRKIRDTGQNFCHKRVCKRRKEEGLFQCKACIQR